MKSNATRTQAVCLGLPHLPSPPPSNHAPSLLLRVLGRLRGMPFALAGVVVSVIFEWVVVRLFLGYEDGTNTVGDVAKVAITG